MEIDETGIEHFAHFGLGEDFAREFLAGATPTGVAIHEDLFALLGGFGQCIFERELLEVHSIVLLESIGEEPEPFAGFAGVAGRRFSEIGHDLLRLFGRHVGEVEGEFVGRAIVAEGIALGAHVVEEFGDAFFSAQLRQFAGYINDGGVGYVGTAGIDLQSEHGIGVVGGGTGGITGGFGVEETLDEIIDLLSVVFHELLFVVEQILVERTFAIGDEFGDDKPVFGFGVVFGFECGHVFLRHLVELFLVVGEIEIVEIGEERLFVALTFLIGGFESGERSFGREGAHDIFFEFGQFLAAHNAQEDVAVGIKHEEVGKAANVVALGDGCVGALAHVDVEIDEIAVHVVGKLGIGEDVFVHTVAGNGPVGEAVEENGLFLCAGTGQSLIERVDIVEFYVGFDAVAVHTGFGLCDDGQRSQRAR